MKLLREWTWKWFVIFMFRAKNVLKIVSRQHIEMKANNIIAPFVFKKVCWLIACLIDWLINSVTEWFFDWLIDWLIGQLRDFFYWLIDWLIDFVIEWLISPLIGSADSLCLRSVGWLDSDWLCAQVMACFTLAGPEDQLVSWLQATAISAKITHLTEHCQREKERERERERETDRQTDRERGRERESKRMVVCW